MKLLRRHLLVTLLLCLAMVGAACGDDEDDAAGGGDRTTTTAASEEDGGDSGGAPGGGSITVGGANFSESSIVASMYAQVLEHAGYDVDTEFDIGARDVYFAALEAGEIDLVPEFVGTLTVFLGGEASSDVDESYEALQGVLPEGIVALEPAPGESTNVFVVTQETADAHDLEQVSDLKGKEGELTLGGPPECPERPFCMQGLEDVYGIDFGDSFQPLDAGGPITKQALADGDIDVALLFSTDGAILENDWVILEDDMDLQQADNVLPVGRDEALDEEARDLLNEVSGLITDEVYLELNRRVGVDQDDPEDVAREFLDENGLLD